MTAFAGITISADNLEELVTLRRISMALMKRIQSNYRFVIGFNGSLIGLGTAGVLAPATSAMLHNPKRGAVASSSDDGRSYFVFLKNSSTCSGAAAQLP